MTTTTATQSKADQQEKQGSADPGAGNHWDDCGYCVLAPTVSGWVRGTQIRCPIHGSDRA